MHCLTARSVNIAMTVKTRFVSTLIRHRKYFVNSKQDLRINRIKPITRRYNPPLDLPGLPQLYIYNNNKIMLFARLCQISMVQHWYRYINLCSAYLHSDLTPEDEGRPCS